MTEHEIKIGVDLSKLVPVNEGTDMLSKLVNTKGLPKDLRENAAMLEELITAGYTAVEDVDLSKEWTVETSPRTKARVAKIIGMEI